MIAYRLHWKFYIFAGNLKFNEFWMSLKFFQPTVESGETSLTISARLVKHLHGLWKQIKEYSVQFAKYANVAFKEYTHEENNFLDIKEYFLCFTLLYKSLTENLLIFSHSRLRIHFCFPLSFSFLCLPLYTEISLLPYCIPPLLRQREINSLKYIQFLLQMATRK